MSDRNSKPAAAAAPSSSSSSASSSSSSLLSSIPPPHRSLISTYDGIGAASRLSTSDAGRQPSTTVGGRTTAPTVAPRAPVTAALVPAGITAAIDSSAASTASPLHAASAVILQQVRAAELAVSARQHQLSRLREPISSPLPRYAGVPAAASPISTVYAEAFGQPSPATPMQYMPATMSALPPIDYGFIARSDDTATGVALSQVRNAMAGAGDMSAEQYGSQLRESEMELSRIEALNHSRRQELAELAAEQAADDADIERRRIGEEMADRITTMADVNIRLVQAQHEERRLEAAERAQRLAATASRHSRQSTSAAAAATALAGDAASRTSNDRAKARRKTAMLVRRFGGRSSLYAGGSGGGGGGGSSDSSSSDDDVSTDYSGSDSDTGGGGGGHILPPATASAGAAHAAAEARQVAMRATVIHTTPPFELDVYDGDGGSLKLQTWLKQVERRVQPHKLNVIYDAQFPEIESLVKSKMSDSVYHWYVSECTARDQTGEPGAVIDTWAKFRTVMHRQFKSVHEELLASNEWYSGVMVPRPGEDIMKYMSRIIEFRERLSPANFPPPVFLHAIIHNARGAFSSINHELRKWIHKHRHDPPSLHDLREKMVKLTRDVGIKAADSKPAAAAQPATAPQRPHQQHQGGNNKGKPQQQHRVNTIGTGDADAGGSVEDQLAAALRRASTAEHKLGMERQGHSTKAARGKGAAAKLNAMRTERPAGAAAEGAALQSRFPFRYDAAAMDKLKANRRCFKCGAEGHRSRECDKAAIDLTSLIAGLSN